MTRYPAPRAEEFSTVGVQATLFTPGASVVPNEVAKRLIGGAWVDHFDGDPVMLPSDPGIPREIPKVILRDKRGIWHAEIADARVSIKWRWGELSTAPDDLEAVFRQSAARLEEYRSAFSPRVGRLAAVTQRFVLNDAPGLTLASHFCREEQREGPLNRPENFELHAHKVFTFADFTVNSWVRNKTARISSAGSKRHGILVEQDLNTLAEQATSRDFEVDEVTRFFSTVGQELRSILALYYPQPAAGGSS